MKRLSCRTFPFVLVWIGALLAFDAAAQDLDETPNVMDADDAQTDDDAQTAADAQTADDDANIDDADILENVHAQQAPDGTLDYTEMHQMHVLERTFLPETDNAQDVSGLLIPDDPMALSHNAVMQLLGDGSDLSRKQHGLQRRADKLMKDAVRQIEHRLSAVGKDFVQPFGIDCAAQPAVKEYVAIFSAPGSATMKIWLKRLGRYRDVLEKVLIEENVPTDLVYLAMIESGFKTRVKSPAAAAGMWQFMAGTAAEMGLRIDEYVDERFDPIKSAHAAAKYLKKQFARYNVWQLAMAAYNGGPGTVNVAIDRYNTTDYFKLVEYGAMYDETRRYVPRILAAALIGRNPKAFGFDGLTPEPPFVFDSVSVPGNTRLALLADAANCSVDTLKELNPELLKEITPPGESYLLRIPLHTFDKFVEKFDQVQKKYANASDIMTLKFGETIDTLAQNIDVPPRVLRNLNKLGARDDAPYGSEIIVPNGSKRTHKMIPDDEKRLVPISPELFDLPGKKRVFYETQRGDSILAIANAFHVLPNQLAIWNELDILANLRPKMILQIFVDRIDENVRYINEEDLKIVARGSDEHREFIAAKTKARLNSAKKNASSKNSKSSASYYTVKKGDSLSKIAKKYDVSVNDLIKWNKLKGNAIRQGQKLKIKK